jgi:MYXO-CTERM domain-containing protein
VRFGKGAWFVATLAFAACSESETEPVSRVREPVEAFQRGVYYDIGFAPAPSFAALRAQRPAASDFQIVESMSRELATLGLPSWSSGAIMLPALSGVNGVPLRAPLPADSALRFSCGATLISPSYVVTAGHCVTLDGDVTALKLTMYRPTAALAESYLASTVLSGDFPLYTHPVLDAADGYLVDEYACSVVSRCYDQNVACADSGADVALLRCDGAPGQKYGYSNVMRDNPTGLEALVVWKHELYDMGENPVRQDLVDHYMRRGSGYAQNYHYFEQGNQLLPLRSIPWSDGSLPRFLDARSADLYGCHGTSGSGMFARMPGSAEFRLAGTVAVGTADISEYLCGHVPSLSGSPAGPGVVGFRARWQPATFLASFESTIDQDCKTRGEIERDLEGLPFDPGSHQIASVFSHLDCAISDFAADGSRRTPPALGAYADRQIDDPGTGTEHLAQGFALEAGADYRFGVQVETFGACSTSDCGHLELRHGAVTATLPLPLVPAMTSAVTLFSSEVTGPVELGVRNVGIQRGLSSLVLIREGQVNSFDALEDRLEASLSVLADNGDVRAGGLPMRFVGDGSVGFAARLEPGERMSLLRQALPAGRRFTLRIGTTDFTDLACGLLDTQGFRESTVPCSSVVVLDDREGTEGRLGVYLELPTTATTAREIRYVAVASDAARDADADAVPDVLDNCPSDWNPSQLECLEIPPDPAGGAGGEAGAATPEAGGEGGRPLVAGAGGDAGGDAGGNAEPAGGGGATTDAGRSGSGAGDGGEESVDQGGASGFAGADPTPGAGVGGETSTPPGEGGQAATPPLGGSAGSAGSGGSAGSAAKKSTGCDCSTTSTGRDARGIGLFLLGVLALTRRRRERSRETSTTLRAAVARPA